MPDRDESQVPPLASAGLGLGERLRSARKARALTVEQVAESLLLEVATVVAIEDGRFDALGAPVFVRGHLRRYAQMVGLPPEAVLDAYRAAAPGSDAPPVIARPRDQADVLRVPSWVYWLAAVLVITGLVIALPQDEDEPLAPATAPPVMAPAAAPPAQPVEVPVTPAPGEADAATGTEGPAAPAVTSPPATGPAAGSSPSGAAPAPSPEPEQ